MRIDKVTAVRRLTNRWHEQTAKFPAGMRTITLAGYIKANLRVVMSDDPENLFPMGRLFEYNSRD